jgi:hypothetical protein
MPHPDELKQRKAVNPRHLGVGDDHVGTLLLEML